MKTFAKVLGVALALGAAPALCGQSRQAIAPVSHGVASQSPILIDDPDGTEGDGVIDPVPQDDGTPGVDVGDEG